MFACFYVINNLLCPGKVENWTLINDLNNLAISKLPVKFIINFLKTLQTHLKCRGRAFIVLKVTWAIRALWTTISPFVDNRIKKKITMSKDGTHEILQELIHPSQLEQKFGGEAENLTEFWPPRHISDEFGHDPDLIVETDFDDHENEDSVVSCMFFFTILYLFHFKDSFRLRI